MDVVEDGRLEIREEQVQMVKFQFVEGSRREEKKVITALDLADEVISGQRQLKLTGNKDAKSITGAAVLKAKETNKIRGPSRWVFRNSRKYEWGRTGENQEIENEWGSLGG